MDPMNVLFLIHRYPPALGGSERYVQAMGRRLVLAGHRATVYTSDLLDMEGAWQPGRQRLTAGEEDDAGVRVRRFQARVLPLHSATSRLPSLVPWAPVGMTMAPPGLVLPGLWRAVRTPGRLDLVHASAYPSLMYLGLVAARRSGAKAVLMPCTHPGADDDGTQRHYFVSPQMIDLYRQADAIIALTGREQQVLAQAGVPEDKIHVTGAGTDPQEARGADGQRFREKFGLAASTSIVAFVGHKTVGKGALDLLEASQPLVAERPDLAIAMVGAPTQAFTQRLRALPAQVRDKVLDLRLSEQDKHDLLAASSALVLPSQDDSFGIVLLEAWLHGKPVIGARAGGIPDVIEEGKTGLLMQHGDVQALADAITWLLDHPAQAALMGSRGRETTRDRWTWDAVYERVQAVYGYVLAQ
jgi:glycosyltransferase involved in cell wall biosynthesis